MFCQTCGAGVDASLRFCPRCGSPQPVAVSPTTVQPYSPPSQLSARPGAWIGAGWNLVKANLGVSIGAILLIAILNTFVPFILAGPLLVGLHFLYVKALRGQRPAIADLFYGFQFFLPAMLAGIVISALTTIGFFFLIIPGLILTTLFGFTYLFILDKKMEFWPAMMASKDLVMKDLFGFFWMLILGAGLLNLLGILCFLIGILVTAPIYFAGLTVAYQELVGFSDSTGA